MADLVRVISWNLAYGKPAGFKTIANRRRQWALLGAVAADVVLLQECRPSDLRLHAPAWMADEYQCVGVLRQDWRLCASMLVRQPHVVEPLDLRELGGVERRWLEHLPGCWAAASVTIDGVRIAVASIHALAMEVELGAAVSFEDHERLRRTGLPRAWCNDVLVGALEPWVAGRRFIVGGDWNNSPLFDANYPRRSARGVGPSTEFFQRRKLAEWHDAMRKFHDGDVRTYLDERSAPYELDHVFVDATTYEGVANCEAVDHVTTRGLSDHAPVVVEFAV